METDNVYSDTEPDTESDTESDTEPEDEVLDTDWVNEQKETESIYNDFYKEPVTSIAIYLLYVNKDNELTELRRDRCLFEEPSVLKRDIVISFIKRYQLLLSVNYKMKWLLQYNIDLNPSEINDFIKEDKNNLFENRFIKSEKYLNDIYYEDTIKMFQDLNALFFIYTEEKPVINHNNTRRIMFGRDKHKTKRNNFKEKQKNLKIFKGID